MRRMDARLEQLERRRRYGVCQYCGDNPQKHEGRCPSAVFRRGRVMRCLKTREHDDAHVYSEPPPMLDTLQ